MNPVDFAAPPRLLAVPAVVSALVAGWFVLASGALVAEAAGVRPATTAQG